MTEQHNHPVGPSEVDDAIGAVMITFHGDELTWDLAAKQLRLFADMLDAQTLHTEGFNWQYGGDYAMNVMMPDAYSHGDYQDEEGNLLHVNNDHVVSVNWANKQGEREDLEDVHVFEWIRDHGPIKRAGTTTDDGGHLRAVNDDDEQ